MYTAYIILSYRLSVSGFLEPLAVFKKKNSLCDRVVVPLVDRGDFILHSKSNHLFFFFLFKKCRFISSSRAGHLWMTYDDPVADHAIETQFLPLIRYNFLIKFFFLAFFLVF